MTQVGSASKKCPIWFIKPFRTYRFQSLVNHMRCLPVQRRYEENVEYRGWVGGVK